MTAPILTLMSHMWPEYDYSANVIVAAVMDVTCSDCGVTSSMSVEFPYAELCGNGVCDECGWVNEGIAEPERVRG